MPASGKKLIWIDIKPSGEPCDRHQRDVDGARLDRLNHSRRDVAPLRRDLLSPPALGPQTPNVATQALAQAAEGRASIKPSAVMTPLAHARARP